MELSQLTSSDGLFSFLDRLLGRADKLGVTPRQGQDPRALSSFAFKSLFFSLLLWFICLLCLSCASGYRYVPYL
ncbi:hypothetical protein CEP54_006227 [Fusarium duplospermum]|uniref:Uncharacterized protein n=1 Tax=Fusarium duplospermum TaxID=1325734 RepID=A0A428Q852_9HYPO|nr:hypothetical protein CEP54_006227 [Fusarium duplospermum]